MSALRSRLSQLKRIASGVDRAAKASYLENNPIRKLHIGASNRALAGWLNTDIAPSPGVIQMDATRPFPFADGTFTYILAEHMIEHVTAERGLDMLAECHRVMGDGGILRIVTPDLEKLAGFYSRAGGQDYIDWFCATFLLADQPRTAGSVINAQFEMWGHQCLYDETLLCDAMAKAGFRAMTRCEVGESGHTSLRGIENEARYPEGFLRLESLVIEAAR